VILLDTNVLSELMKPCASKAVVEWLDQQQPEDLYISAITRAEIELGLNLLPGGKKRDRLRQAAGEMFEEFVGRCLPFEEFAAVVYGELVAQRQASGRPISVEDAQIASIALVHDLMLASRNTGDFESVHDLSLVNPWREGSG